MPREGGDADAQPRDEFRAENFAPCNEVEGFHGHHIVLIDILRVAASETVVKRFGARHVCVKVVLKDVGSAAQC